MLNKKDYCDYDTAITLGELGFPLKRMKVKNFIDGQFSDSIVTVLLYEAQKWLREERKIDIFVRAGYLGKNRVRHYFVEVFTSKGVITLDNDREDFDSYEEALLEGIKEAIKLLKEVLVMGEIDFNRDIDE